MTPTDPGSNHYALIGDVVGSRDLDERAEVQRTLAEFLESLNHRFWGGGDAEASLAVPIKLTAGDEMQALLRAPAPTVDIVVSIADALYPVEVVWGLGMGSISTDLVEDVALVDGPCFHRAREAVEDAADQSAWLQARGFPAPFSETLSALFQLMGAVRSRWKPAQMRYIRSARDRAQNEVAKMHEVDESTVSKALQAARFRDVEAAEEAARRLLAWIADSEVVHGGAP
jgi:hypothetical protein